MWILHRLLLCLQVTLSPRALVLIRRDSPAALVIPGFIFGQAFPLLALVLSAVALILHRRILLTGLTLGLLSSPALIPVPALPTELSSSTERSFLVQVEELRFPKPGLVSFSANLRGIVSEQTPSSITLLSRQVRARLQTPHLGWRNADLLTENSLVVARFRPERIKSDGWPWSFDAHLSRLGFELTGRVSVVSAPLNGIDYEDYSALELSENFTILQSLALGKRDVVSRESEQLFKELGLAHLLVFSGFQILLVASLSSYLVRGMFCRFIARADLAGASVGLMAALVLTHLSGWEPSGYRALLAYGYWLSTRHLLGVTTTRLQTISVAYIAVAIILPNALWEIGVQLTFGALVGFLVAPWRGAFAGALSATLSTSLISLLWFNQVAPIALLMNATVAPLMSITGTVLAYPVLALVHLDVAGWGTAVGEFIGGTHLEVLRAIRDIAAWTGLGASTPSGITRVSWIMALAMINTTLIGHATLRYYERNGIVSSPPPVPNRRNPLCTPSI